MMNIEVIGISPTVNVFLDLGTMYRARSSHLKNLSVQKYNFLTTPLPTTPRYPLPSEISLPCPSGCFCVTSFNLFVRQNLSFLIIRLSAIVDAKISVTTNMVDALGETSWLDKPPHHVFIYLIHYLQSNKIE